MVDRIKREEDDSPDKSQEPTLTSAPRRRIDFGKLLLGLTVVLIGLILLARNFGFIDIDLFSEWWRFWPILIIIVGLSLLSGKGWASFFVGLLVTILVLGIMLFAFVFGDNGNINRSSTARESFSIEREAGVDAATIEIRTGAGKLNIGGGSSELVSGMHESRFFTLDRESKIEDNRQIILFKSRGNGSLVGRQVNNLEMDLSNQLPVRLKLDVGAIDMRLDLTEIMMEEIDIDTGASSLDLSIGDRVPEMKANIDAGASSINISLPRTVGARIVLKSGLSSRTLEDFKQINSNTFESDNFNSAQNKVLLDLDLGASSLDVGWR